MDRPFNHRPWPTWGWYRRRMRIFGMQRRIYRASRDGDLTTVHRLQRQLTVSMDARLHAVRHVTTADRSGSSPPIPLTAGEKMATAYRLHPDGLAPGHIGLNARVELGRGGDQRRCHGTVLQDRAKQYLARLVLEPQHQAYLGSELGGACPRPQAAQDALRHALTSGLDETYVLNARIVGRNDGVHHALGYGLRSYPEMNAQIRSWLVAGAGHRCDGQSPPVEDHIRALATGGGPLSPLLVNILVQGLSSGVQNAIPADFASENPSFTVYADNLVIVHERPSVLQHIVRAFELYLGGLGLKLDTMKPAYGLASQAFHSLGFTIRTYRRRCGRTKTQIYPSKASVLRHGAAIRRIVQANKSTAAGQLIQKLRPLIVGWSNYFRSCECNHISHKLDFTVHEKLRAWMWRRDKRSRAVVKEKYMPSGKTYVYLNKQHRSNWVLVGNTLDKAGLAMVNFLPRHTWAGVERGVSVVGDG